jgi:hypothetical protein
MARGTVCYVGRYVGRVLRGSIRLELAAISGCLRGATTKDRVLALPPERSWQERVEVPRDFS